MQSHAKLKKQRFVPLTPPPATLFEPATSWFRAFRFHSDNDGCSAHTHTHTSPSNSAPPVEAADIIYGVGGGGPNPGFSIGPFIRGSGTLINTSPQRWEEVTQMNTAASPERSKKKKKMPPHPHHRQPELRLNFSQLNVQISVLRQRPRKTLTSRVIKLPS